MNATMMEVVPVVDVPVHIGLHLRAGRQQVPQRLGVFQAAGKVDFLAPKARVVMGEDQGGLACVGVEHVSKPTQLLLTEEALGHHGFLQRVQQE